MNNKNLEFAGRLKQLIENKNITAYEVAFRTGISQATLSRILNSNTSKMNIRNLDLLTNYFNVNRTWLLTGEGEMLRDEEKTTVDLNNPTEKQLLGVEIENKMLRKQLAKLDNDIRELIEITAVLKYRLKNEDKNEAV
jgi:transcriptional regulator with XRE-family HTH domain